MKTLFNPPEYFNEDYYERGAETGKSLYSHYRWMPELTIPMAHHIAKYMDLHESEKVLDFGCAKGFTVKALRLLGYKAYGVDVSQYAFDEMDAKTGKWCGVIEPQEPLVCAEGGYDWILCKDILEHIPYDKIDEQLKVLYNGGKRVMAMIPLGDGEKYIIDSYELDKSHFIRESLQWWHEKFEQAGFDVDMSTYDMGPFKKNWQFEPEGNALIIASK
jgi:SAM-dependent methyltransferase